MNLERIFVMNHNVYIFSAKSGNAMQKLRAEEGPQPTDREQEPSNTEANSTLRKSKVSKDSTNFDQNMTGHHSKDQSTRPVEQSSFQPEVPEQPNISDIPPPPPPTQNEHLAQNRSPPIPDIPSMASLNLGPDRDNSSTLSGQRPNEISFTSDDAGHAISNQLSKTNNCTFHDIASKVSFQNKSAELLSS